MRPPAESLLSALIIAASAIVADAKSAPPTPTKSSNSICSIERNEIVPDGCASYSTIDSLNKKLSPLVKEITQSTDFFSYYRLDLFGRTCPFWSDDEGMCGNIACAVNTIDDEENIPPIWRAEELGKLAGPKASHPAKRSPTDPSPLSGALGVELEESCIVEDDECDERDYCVPEDETEGSKGDYVSLVENPERFTGYVGSGAENVWKAIYRENCFSKTPEVDNSASSSPLKTKNQAEMGFVNVLREKGKHEVEKHDGKPHLLELNVDDECLEKRVFYRVISGMHASISMHLCWDYLNQSTGEWGPNLDCFISRFSEHPERLQNIYFNYAILLRAVAKLRNYLPTYTFCSGDYHQNRLTKSKVLKLANTAANGPEIFDESLMFQDEMIGLKEDFRNRFRNISRLMDCVGCDKCRLWGKVQTQGYGTALKILFEFDEFKDGGKENPVLRRTELVALINTLDRVSSSLSAIANFQKMWETRNETERKETNDEQQQKQKQPEPAKDKGEDQQKKINPEDESFAEQFLQEWDLVWQTFGVVIHSWVTLPKTLFILAVSEASQIWDSVIGRVRQEGFLWAGKDEL